MNTKEWDDILFGINKGLGMVQQILLTVPEKIKKIDMQKAVSDLQDAADKFSYGGVKK